MQAKTKLMIVAASFIEQAKARGLVFYSGVPCSFLTPVINRAISDSATHYVGATSEGEALAIAAGAWLAGLGTVVMCQNSGLGNMINPLTSLNWPFQIPTLLVVTWRGQPGLKDEPQHALMGRVTTRFLEDANVTHRPFPSDGDTIGETLDDAIGKMRETSRPHALTMEKGAVADEPLDRSAAEASAPGEFHDFSIGGGRPTRIAALERLLKVVPDNAAVIATTGKCGRELFTLADREQHFYQVGSMGCASAIALGVAVNVDRPVVVVDGDGAALMKLGNLGTIGSQRPKNFVHVILDNGVHDSTGGQATVSATVDFARVALACGYAKGISADGLDGLADGIDRALATDGPALVHVRIRPGSTSPLGRPTIPPRDLARRFRQFLARE